VVEGSTQLHNFALVVGHYVVTTRPGMDPIYNQKTLEEWKALVPADTFIQAGSGRAL